MREDERWTWCANDAMMRCDPNRNSSFLCQVIEMLPLTDCARGHIVTVHLSLQHVAHWSNGQRPSKLLSSRPSCIVQLSEQEERKCRGATPQTLQSISNQSNKSKAPSVRPSVGLFLVLLQRNKTYVWDYRLGSFVSFWWCVDREFVIRLMKQLASPSSTRRMYLARSRLAKTNETKANTSNWIFSLRIRRVRSPLDVFGAKSQIDGTGQPSFDF